MKADQVITKITGIFI